MKVDDCKYVSLRYKLSLESGEAAGSSPDEEPLRFIVGTNQIIPGLEKGVLGMEAGQQARIRVEATDAYGEYRPDLIRDIPRENFPEEVELEVGMGFEARGPHGPVLFRIHAVDEESVSADFNHPLAGETLYFDVKIEDVREPTPEELAEAQETCASESSCAAGCSSCGGSCG
ncbi:MAG: peptidylprolyl isomerase [Deltaproteobacteria bacterium]|nr:peptidylprolyl isomerase [Deltaproteobacteria bacterium]